MRVWLLGLVLTTASLSATGVVTQEPPAHPQSFQLAAYQNMKRDPAMAGLLSAIVPSLGHAYAGRPVNGVIFFIFESAEAAGAYFTLRAVADTVYYRTKAQDDSLLTVGVACAVALALTKMWECADAVVATDKYNEALRGRLDLKLGTNGHGRGATVGLAWRL
jgi:hypothetical protein